MQSMHRGGRGEIEGSCAAREESKGSVRDREEVREGDGRSSSRGGGGKKTVRSSQKC